MIRTPPSPCRAACVLACVAWLGLGAGVPGAAAREPAVAAPPGVACTVEPALATGSPLTLRAWAIDAGGLPAELPPGLRWEVDRGAVDAAPAGGGEPARWTIPDRPSSGMLRARLLRDDGSVVCAVSARRVPGIRGDPPPAAAARARHFLARDREEPRGYAALAYLLLPAPPAPAERERCLQVLAAWLRQLPPSAEMELYVERSELTLFLLPVREPPALQLDGAATTDPQAYRRAALALLAVYDHARAQALMARLGLASDGPGPLLVTHQAALGGGPATQLVEDFGPVDASIADPWMRWSLSLVSQPRERSAESLQRLAMTLRNVIAHVARGLPGGGAAARESIRVGPAPAR